jgi:hypothetical protein
VCIISKSATNNEFVFPGIASFGASFCPAADFSSATLLTVKSVFAVLPSAISFEAV